MTFCVGELFTIKNVKLDGNWKSQHCSLWPTRTLNLQIIKKKIFFKAVVFIKRKSAIIVLTVGPIFTILLLLKFERKSISSGCYLRITCANTNLKNVENLKEKALMQSFKLLTQTISFK
jgi:hypothetical protein